MASRTWACVTSGSLNLWTQGLWTCVTSWILNMCDLRDAEPAKILWPCSYMASETWICVTSGTLDLWTQGSRTCGTSDNSNIWVNSCGLNLCELRDPLLCDISTWKGVTLVALYWVTSLTLKLSVNWIHRPITCVLPDLMGVVPVLQTGLDLCKFSDAGLEWPEVLESVWSLVPGCMILGTMDL